MKITIPSGKTIPKYNENLQIGKQLSFEKESERIGYDEHELGGPFIQERKVKMKN